jgi:hypothetical protein
MFSKPQDQKVKEGAIAVQVGTSAESVTINHTTNHGLTVDQVRAVAQDTFRADFFRFLDHAGDVATARAQKVIESYLDRIQKENPAALEQANDPDFRYALLTAQRANARNGDESLETILVELLVERSCEPQRSLQQIVLNEALDVVSRLTDEQMAALTVSFVLRKTLNPAIVDFNAWLEMMDARVQPFIEQAKLSRASFSHIAFTGCGVVEMGEISLAQVFFASYPGIWQAGFAHDDPVVQQLNPYARNLLRASAHAPELLEVLDGAADHSARLREAVLPDESQRRLIDQLVARPRLNLEEIKTRSLGARPYMEALFDLWNNTSMKHFVSSSVGDAIAHANISRLVPNFGPLSIWVN